MVLKFKNDMTVKKQQRIRIIEDKMLMFVRLRISQDDGARSFGCNQVFHVVQRVVQRLFEHGCARLFARVES